MVMLLILERIFYKCKLN